MVVEHGLHGLNRGPDGWVYMSKGNSKGLNQAPERVAPKAFRVLWGMEAPVGTPDFPASKKYTATSYQNTFHHPSDDWGLNGGLHLGWRPTGAYNRIGGPRANNGSGIWSATHSP